MTTIARLIDERPLNGLQARIAILCGLVVFLDGFDVQAMGLVVPTLAADGGFRPPPSAWP